MRRTALISLGFAAAMAGLSAAPAAAQSLIAEYYTTIRAEDMRNSRGQRLTNYCAIIQQDRANYHRFGIRHQGDQSDPVFSSREARAAMAGRCRVAPGSEYIPSTLESGQTRFLWIRVYGYGNTPTDVLVSEGAG